MHQLTGERGMKGINNIAEFGNYYRKFLSITHKLVQDHKMTEREQSENFIRGFGPQLEHMVRDWLRIKCVDKRYGDHYTMAELTEASNHYLEGTHSWSTTGSSYSCHSRPSPLPYQTVNTASPSSGIKAEDIATLAETMAAVFIKKIKPLIKPTNTVNTFRTK